MNPGSQLLDRTMRFVGIFITVSLVVFLLAPVALVILLSFSNEAAIYFPPRGWGLRQYETLFASERWLGAIRTSFEVAIPAAALSVALAVPALFAMERTRMRGGEILRAAGVSSLILPLVAYAIALYGLAVQLGLLGTRLGLILAHATLGVPLVLIVAGEGLKRLPRDLEYVAMTLGASRAQAWGGITLRLLAPSIVAAGFFAFIMSFDEAVFVNFMSGVGVITLPKAIFDSVRFGVDAVITAIATLLILGTAVLAILASWLHKRTGRAE